MDPVQALNQARKACLLAATTTGDTATQLATQIQSDTPDIDEVRVLVANLSLELDELKQSQTHYCSLVPDDQLQDVLANLASTKKSISKTLSQGQTLITKFDKDNLGSSGCDNGRHKIKLPDHLVPKFSGDHTKWQEYWDQMESSVFNLDLDTIKIFQYLRRSLKGEALELIAGFATTVDNFDKAKEQLKAEYGQVDRIQAAHFTVLFDLPAPVKYKGSYKLDYKSFKDFELKIQTTTRCLETLNVKPEQYEIPFMVKFINMLPGEFKASWFAVTNRTMDSFIEFLNVN